MELVSTAGGWGDRKSPLRPPIKTSLNPMDATANFSLRFARASESKVETLDWFSEQKADRFYRLLLAEISSAQKAGTEVSREKFEEIWDFVFNSEIE